MIKKIIYRLFGTPVDRYFKPGVRYLATIQLAFARETALEAGMDFVLRCEVHGDYAEFGVFRGRTFAAAVFHGRERKLPIRYWDFDSFEACPRMRASL